MKTKKVCPVCKKEFIAERKDKIYCSKKCQIYAADCRRKNRPIDYSTPTKICLHCGKEFQPHSLGQTRAYCFNCVPEGTYKLGGNVMRDIIKSWAIEYKGEKCEICGYNRCKEALDFHHLIPEEKEFKISDRNLPTSDWPRIKKELDKCILVCANCHREIHNNYINLEEFLNK